MSITIQFDDPLATRLRQEARTRSVAPEELASELLKSAFKEIDALAAWPKRNQRRCDLIRKDIHGGGLTAEEAAELERLDAEADRRVAAWDQQLLDQLQIWEAAVQRLKNS